MNAYVEIGIPVLATAAVTLIVFLLTRSIERAWGNEVLAQAMENERYRERYGEQ